MYSLFEKHKPCYKVLMYPIPEMNRSNKSIPKGTKPN